MSKGLADTTAQQAVPVTTVLQVTTPKCERLPLGVKLPTRQDSSYALSKRNTPWAVQFCITRMPVGVQPAHPPQCCLIPSPPTSLTEAPASQQRLPTCQHKSHSSRACAAAASPPAAHPSCVHASSNRQTRGQVRAEQLGRVVFGIHWVCHSKESMRAAIARTCQNQFAKRCNVIATTPTGSTNGPQQHCTAVRMRCPRGDPRTHSKAAARGATACSPKHHIPSCTAYCQDRQRRLGVHRTGAWLAWLVCSHQHATNQRPRLA